MPMTKILVQLTGIGLVWLLSLSLALVAHAQDPGDRDDKSGPSVIGSQGLADPAPTGFTVLYTFTGARDIQYPTPDKPENKENIAATSVHCTNAGGNFVQLRVEIYDFNNKYTLTVTEAITPNYTLTFSTQNTALYADDAIIDQSPMNPFNSNIDQGSGRIMADSPAANIICTAQVLDPLGNPPSYVVKLTLYDGNGNFAGGNRAFVFLPVILKQ